MTLGCRCNQAETTALAALLKGMGYQTVPWREVADLYLVNTCTVTASSDQQSRQAIRQAIRRNPSALIVAVGCYAQVNPLAIARIKGVHLILGNGEKFAVKDYLEDLSTHQDRPWIAVGDLSPVRLLQGLPASADPLRTRPLLKIQDGCNEGCTYCIVPLARGPQRSLPPEEVINQFGQWLRRGFQEIVLTGIRLGAYGQDLGPAVHLSGLLRDLTRLPGEWRVRLSSLEPQDLTPDLIDHLRESSHLCRHLHLPLQSGDDEILARMGRATSTAAYRRLLLALKAKIPEMGLGADIIVGFPGETEDHFSRTYRFLEEMPLSYLHVFPFSARPGTPAASLRGAPSPQEKRERAAHLRTLGRKKAFAFRSSFIGKGLQAIVLKKQDAHGKGWLGLTDNYLPVLIPEGGEGMVGQLLFVQIEGVHQSLLVGRGRT
ncbi:MAG: tRNA (N(6)-L-threonylcarbamoyladenosine(37)-C(2))-methylthiotransferase MtaB [candidate division NC10 bacterium]|nr:tRNA (N(6)-L-threonylcarbamoyladenosine(37)-C(2))-methylthiotransferase MtaB [candidate division NC10 bacterium]